MQVKKSMFERKDISNKNIINLVTIRTNVMGIWTTGAKQAHFFVNLFSESVSSIYFEGVTKMWKHGCIYAASVHLNTDSGLHLPTEITQIKHTTGDSVHKLLSASHLCCRMTFTTPMKILFP